MAILHMAARNQYSLTEYFVSAELRLQSATVVYSSIERWYSPISPDSSAAC